MSATPNAPVISTSQGKYVGMLHELLMAHSVPFGRASHFTQLIPKLVRSDDFRVEFSMLVQWIQHEEGGSLTLNQMLTIIWIAMTGSTVDGLRNANSAPLMIFLSGLGGWSEDEANHKTTLERTPTWDPSEARGQTRTSASDGRKDEKRDERDTFDRTAAAVHRRRLLIAALWLLPVVPPAVLCVVLYRNHAATTVTSEAVPNAAPAADDIKPNRRGSRSSRVSPPHGQPGVESKAEERAAPGQSEQQNAPWPVSGLAVLGDHGQLLTFDRTAPTPSLVTEPAKIHNTKPEQAPAIAEGGARMPGVMPEAVVTVSYPMIVTRETPRTEPDKGRTNVSATESKSPAVMPVVVASSTTPSAPTEARPEARSIPIKGGSSGKPFDLVRPRVAVSAGLLSNDIVKFQMPSYPKSAQKQRLVGDVLARVVISEKGKVAKVVALNGPPSLRQSVEKAVSRWRYLPYVENGIPVAVQTWVTFHFELRES